MAKTETTAPAAAKETKAQKFARLAPPRVQNAIDKIRLIGNVSNKGQYEYTPEQVAKIQAALDGAVKEAMSGFAPDAKGPSATGFSF